MRGGSFAYAASNSIVNNPWTVTVANATLAFYGTTGNAAPTDPTPSTAATSATNFPYPLANTFGYLNAAYWTTPPGGFGSAFSCTNSGIYAGDAVASTGDPFPWIAWNNRPYASPWELMLVPSSPPARLLWEYQLNPAHGGHRVEPIYPVPGTINSYTPYNTYSPRPPACPIPTCSTFSSRPSRRFTGCWNTWACPRSSCRPRRLSIRPIAAAATRSIPPSTAFPATASRDGSTSTRCTPADVFNGLMNYFPGMTDANGYGTMWSKFLFSRRGHERGERSCSWANLFFSHQPAFPPRQALPFVCRAGFDFISASSSISTSLEVEATLLRGDPTSFASNTPTRPLFQIDSTGNDATTAIAGHGNLIIRTATRCSATRGSSGWPTSSPPAPTSTPSGLPWAISR